MHEGHRSRLREKVLKDATETHEKLELLLFSALPRVNTNEIAHELLQAFGDINGVFCASVEQLMSVQGIGRAAAIQIRNVASIIREYQLCQCATDMLLTSEIQLHKYLTAIFVGVPQEITYMLMFSKTKRYLGYKAIGMGDLVQNTVLLGKAVKFASELGAKYVIVAHNHPCQAPFASDTDIKTARIMNTCFLGGGIDVCGHFIVSEGMCERINGSDTVVDNR